MAQIPSENTRLGSTFRGGATAIREPRPAVPNTRPGASGTPVDIEDLLRWLVDELVEEVCDGDGRFRLDSLLAFVCGMPEVSRAFLRIESCAERCQSALADALPHPDPATRWFAAAGAMGLLSHWLHADDPPPLELLIEQACSLVDGVVGSGSGTASD